MSRPVVEKYYGFMEMITYWYWGLGEAMVVMVGVYKILAMRSVVLKAQI
jgi:hypothetical protein